MHDLTTRTVNMSRDQQIDHGFGICVKGGKDSGELLNNINKKHTLSQHST